MPDRAIRDRLIQEYFDYLPDIRRVVWQLETEIRYRTLPILHNLEPHEQLIVKSRVKDCQSAVNALQRRQEGNLFDPELADQYSVLQLPDLAGVRVLVFPRARLVAVDQILRGAESFLDWTPDPVRDASGANLASKYYGYCREVSEKVRGEYQIVPMLIGYFWEVEHSAMYKPAQSLSGIMKSRQMQELRTGVESALSRFEEEFERFVKMNSDMPSPHS
jgi:ppGpp synthetase/RelA/SpoT-type nucleotidyltranferase